MKFNEIRTISDLQSYITQWQTNETGVLIDANTIFIYDRATKKVIEKIILK